MKISVIVSTYNSPDWLQKVLWGYCAQSDRDFEVVVADDGSGDETRALIDSFRDRLTIRHVWHQDDGFQKWRIVNRAVVEAAGDYLLFSDGDCIPRAEVIAVHRARARQGHYVSGGYCKLPMATSQQIGEQEIASGRAFSISWLAGKGYSPTLKWLKITAAPWGVDGLLNTLTPAKPTFNGNNSSCWKADAMAVGGFDERIRYGGGDREFGYRLSHHGIRPTVIRYSALMLHLDHSRGYKDPAIRAGNNKIIAETLTARRTRTDFGIQP